MLCRWYWPRFGGRVNCFLISAEEYLGLKQKNLNEVVILKHHHIQMQNELLYFVVKNLTVIS